MESICLTTQRKSGELSAYFWMHVACNFKCYHQMAGCMYRIANAFRVTTFCFGDLSLKCSSHAAHIMSRDADGVLCLLCVGKTRQTTSGLSTDFCPKMYQILYKVRECLLSFGAESSVFHFATENFKDYNIQKYNFACWLYGCELGRTCGGEEGWLRLFENRV